MDFDVFCRESIWTIADALKPTWQSAFIRCILDDTAMSGPGISSTDSISPRGPSLGLSNEQDDKRVEEFKRLANMYAERARQM